MSSENTPEEAEVKPRKVAFNLDFNLGHLFVVFSLFLSAAGLYAHDETRLTLVEERVKTIDSQNLSNRLTTSEVKILALTDRLDGIHDVLLEIRNELAQNHHETVTAVRIVAKKAVDLQKQSDNNSKAIKNRIFP